MRIRNNNLRGRVTWERGNTHTSRGKKRERGKGLTGAQKKVKIEVM